MTREQFDATAILIAMVERRISEGDDPWWEDSQREVWLRFLRAMGETQADDPNPETWGAPVRYQCDDRDREGSLDLVIQQGGNGDWYVSVIPHEQRAAMRGVRISTSGGASFAVPGLTMAIAHAYRALRAVKT